MARTPRPGLRQAYDAEGRAQQQALAQMLAQLFSHVPMSKKPPGGFSTPPPARFLPEATGGEIDPYGATQLYQDPIDVGGGNALAKLPDLGGRPPIAPGAGLGGRGGPVSTVNDRGGFSMSMPPPVAAAGPASGPPPGVAGPAAAVGLASALGTGAVAYGKRLEHQRKVPTENGPPIAVQSPAGPGLSPQAPSPLGLRPGASGAPSPPPAASPPNLSPSNKPDIQDQNSWTPQTPGDGPSSDVYSPQRGDTLYGIAQALLAGQAGGMPGMTSNRADIMKLVQALAQMKGMQTGNYDPNQLQAGRPMMLPGAGLQGQMPNHSLGLPRASMGGSDPNAPSGPMPSFGGEDELLNRVRRIRGY